MRFYKKVLGASLAFTMAVSMMACGNNDNTDTPTQSNQKEVPTIDKINVGEDYQDINAEIKVLTNRTDIVDTVYKGYAEEFMKVYPNIKVTYEGVTDYEESLRLRLTTGDWGDLCFIPTSVSKNELSDYFTPMGSYSTLDPIYNFCTEKHMKVLFMELLMVERQAVYVITKRYGKMQALIHFQQHQMNF